MRNIAGTLFSFTLTATPESWTLLQTPLYSWGSWGPEKWYHWPKVTQLVTIKLELLSTFVWFQSHDWHEQNETHGMNKGQTKRHLNTLTHPPPPFAWSSVKPSQLISLWEKSFSPVHSLLTQPSEGKPMLNKWMTPGLRKLSLLLLYSKSLCQSIWSKLLGARSHYSVHSGGR